MMFAQESGVAAGVGFIVFAWLIPIAIAALLGYTKRRGAFLGGVLGFFLGWFGVLVMALLRDQSYDEYQTQLAYWQAQQLQQIAANQSGAGWYVDARGVNHYWDGQRWAS